MSRHSKMNEHSTPQQTITREQDHTRQLSSALVATTTIEALRAHYRLSKSPKAKYKVSHIQDGKDSE